MARSRSQEIIARILGSRPITFNPDLAKILGSAKAGLFLSQLLYWNGKGRNPEWFYKTVKEFKEETGLSKQEQLAAQKICVEKGVLEAKRMGVPAKRHFKINKEKIIELLSRLKKSEDTQMSRNSKSDVLKPDN